MPSDFYYKETARNYRELGRELPPEIAAGLAEVERREAKDESPIVSAWEMPIVPAWPVCTRCGGSGKRSYGGDSLSLSSPCEACGGTGHSLRQTGRTTAMLKKASIAKSAGYRIMIVVHQESMVATCLDSLGGRDMGLLVSEFTVPANILRGRLTGKRIDTFFEDHYVAEVVEPSHYAMYQAWFTVRREDRPIL